MNDLINSFKKDVDNLIKVAEESKHYPDNFKKTVTYLHDCFAYLLSLIEINDQEKN
tara:strand:+ start:678 stop:845 length:168 start_codon:yes stop_codon:yes gene_type:complete